MDKGKLIDALTCSELETEVLAVANFLIDDEEYTRERAAKALIKIAYNINELKNESLSKLKNMIEGAAE